MGQNCRKCIKPKNVYCNLSQTNKKLELTGNKLIINFTSKFYVDVINKNPEILQTAISQIINENLLIVASFNQEEPEGIPVEEEKIRYTPDDISVNEPVVQKIVELFDGELLPPKE